MRSVIIAANWKMHKTIMEAEDFIDRLKKEEDKLPSAQLVICAPYITLPVLSASLENLQVSLGAQNMHWAKEGAYTGEISPLMLRELGIRYVIVGHSERRLYFKEDNQMINYKVLAAFEYGLTPILCIGETEAERRGRRTADVIERQLREALRDVPQEAIRNLIVAYEPVWAIGSGNPASGEDANRVAHLIREIIGTLYSEEDASRMRVQYGGSVKADNIGEFMRYADIDGALVGGASLEVSSFLPLIREGVAAKEANS
ncbi:MAG: triose-phosphate isomerase [Dethiobacteria bacterium]|jgi:triosephosphate isomerase|nr:triose-phosphate isomerase [Bacillota bacterium]